MTPLRVMFYVQHLLGIGHLARASHLARAMLAAGIEVTLVTGGRPVPGFPGADLPHLALPAIAVADSGFAGLVDGEGRPVDRSFLDRRRDLLLDIYRRLRPDIVLLEAFPFGRKQVRFELLPLIDAIEATATRPKLVVSLRDILQRRSKPASDQDAVAIVRAHVDRVLVHGDPGFAALGDSFPLAGEIAGRISYTGLVCGPPAAPSPERHDVLVSAGGGAVGAGLLGAAVGAAKLLPAALRWGILAGPNLPQPAYDTLASAAPSNVALARFRTDFAGLLAAARVSVSQAGYNTVGDVLQAGARAVLVPYAADGETEQSDRAARLQRLGRAEVIPESGLSPAALADAVKAALAQPGSRNAPPIATDGAGRTAEILQEL